VGRLARERSNRRDDKLGREYVPASPRCATNSCEYFVSRNQLDNAALDLCDAFAKFFVPGGIDFWFKIALERSEQLLCEPGSIFGGKLARALRQLGDGVRHGLAPA
jgi:hypothetical protein